MSGLKNQLTKRTTRWTLIGVTTGVVVVAAIIGYNVWANHSVVERRLIREAGFPVYAPRSAPKGFTIDTGRTQLNGEVLSYVLINQATNKQITVTVQPKPSNFDMSQMTKGGSVESVTVQLGILYNLSAGGSTRFLLNTGDTLIFMTSPESVDTETVTNLANSLTRFN